MHHKAIKLFLRAMKKVKLNLGARSYTIEIRNGLIDSVASFITKQNGFNRAVFVLTDSNVARFYANRIAEFERKGASVYAIKSGESSKSLTTINDIVGFMMRKRYDRESLLVAFGGGVVGDLGGFTASIFMRGIPFVQVPTTLLSQVDSSVGGKTGVNHPFGKNIIGTFYQPKAVFIDPSLLATLSDKEFINGYAEVVKHGAIHDAALFTFLVKNHDRIFSRDKKILESVVFRNCAIKAAVVEADEKESSLRAILNFGHTFGHAIEALTGYTKYSHGEAVMLGMYAALFTGEYLGVTQGKDADTIRCYIDRIGLPPKLDATKVSVNKFYNAMFADKKVSGGKLSLVLIEQLGLAKVFKNPPKEAVFKGIKSILEE